MSKFKAFAVTEIEFGIKVSHARSKAQVFFSFNAEGNRGREYPRLNIVSQRITGKSMFYSMTSKKA